jgi:hypothetical protein
VTSIGIGTFEITMTPSPPELDGAVARLDFTKIWVGELKGTGSGVLLSCGNPQTGEAGYLAMETFDGELGDRRGGFVFQQSGSMHAGSQILHYDVAPGSGHGELEGITGSLQLSIDENGTHRYQLEYEF